MLCMLLTLALIIQTITIYNQRKKFLKILKIFNQYADILSEDNDIRSLKVLIKLETEVRKIL